MLPQTTRKIGGGGTKEEIRMFDALFKAVNLLTWSIVARQEVALSRLGPIPTKQRTHDLTKVTPLKSTAKSHTTDRSFVLESKIFVWEE
jgi:hypothetical protein